MKRNPPRLSIASPSLVSVLADDAIPSTKEVRAAIPAECFRRSNLISCAYGGFSVVLTLLIGILAWLYVPVSWVWAPVWVMYAIACGTAGTGVWVVAHECGHGAFSDNKKFGNAVGFVLHSALLVPYFSWQRSHAVHHAKTNHLTEGETHVPKVAGTARGQRAIRLHERLGASGYGLLSIVVRLGIGWPLYLVSGTTGSPARGVSNHFWPWAPFESSLFPKRLAPKVLWSAVGVVVTLLLLGWWATSIGSISTVLVLYGGPYLVVNAWLVTYTWLQHTNSDVPHYDADEWSFVKGAFCSVDRPYGRLFNFLHHNIGSTHVVHHLNSAIPHYQAVRATEAVREAFPYLYRFDPTPIPVALWRAGTSCVVVAKEQDDWVYTIPAVGSEPSS